MKTELLLGGESAFFSTESIPVTLTAPSRLSRGIFFQQFLSEKPPIRPWRKAKA